MLTDTTFDFINVRSLKYDLTLHRSWQARIIERGEEFFLVEGYFEKEISHPELGIIKSGTTSVEYFWSDKWFNIFRFHEPKGKFMFFYCNISMPAKFEDQCISFVDLDIDLLVRSDREIQLLDQDEFLENALKFKYPDSVRFHISDSIKEISAMVIDSTYPFDYFTMK